MNSLRKIIVPVLASAVSLSAFAAGLPSGYVALSYVESAGRHVIDTGYAPNPGTHLEIDVQMTGTWGAFGTGGNIFGGSDGTDSSFSCNFGSTDSQKNELFFWYEKGYNDGKGQKTCSVKATDAIRTARNTISVDAPTRVCKWGTASATGTDAKTTTQVQTLHLMGSCGSTGTMTPLTRYGMRVFAVRISEGGELLHEFVPALDLATRTAGLYDLKGGTFHPNVYGERENLLFVDPCEDQLIIAGDPSDVGEVVPAYGTTRNHADGETIACTAPTSFIDEEQAVEWTCVGCTVYAGGVESASKQFGQGEDRTFAYRHVVCAGGCRLVWHWQSRGVLLVATDGRGTAGATCDGGEFGPGAAVTATATPDAGYVFGYWEGAAVDSAHRFDNPYRFTAGADGVALKAVFRKVVYVAADGSDDNGGASWLEPLATVEAALAKDELPYVMVGKGRFDINTAIKVTKGAAICGSGERETVFRLTKDPGEGSDTRAVFYVAHSDATLSNLVVTTGGQAYGRGVYLNGGLVADCAITNCVTVNGTMDGGGVYLVKGTLRDSYLYFNMANSSGGYLKQGGGICMSGGLVERCILRKNTVSNGAAHSDTANASGYGGGIFQTGGTVRNCLLYDNYALGSGNYPARGGDAIEISGGTVENCTIVRNGTKNLGHSAVYATTKNTTIRNTIIRGNRSTTGDESNLTADSNVKLENVMTRGVDREGIITGEPVFVDADNRDWRLRYCACVDAGLDESWMTDGLDLDGKARVVGEHVDLGCYEYVPTGSLACGFDVTTDGTLGESLVALKASVIGAEEGRPITYTWTLVDNQGKERVERVVDIPTLDLTIPVGTYSVLLEVSDGVDNAATPERPNAFRVYAENLYVSPEGSGSFPYADFATAATNVEDAMTYAADGTTVHLSDGVHWLKDKLMVNSGIAFVHDGDPTKAVVTGGRSLTCLILLNHRDAVLSGLDICGSYPNKYIPGGAMPAKAICSGVRIVAGGTVTNCVIESCCADSVSGRDKAQGEGVDMAAGRVVGCIIRNNRVCSSGGGGVHGGGVFMQGGLVEGCVITNNWASPGSDCSGGGVRIKGGTLRNSLIAYCQTSGAGGGISRDGGSVQNCTIVYNAAAKASADGGVSGTVTDCLSYGNTANGVPQQTDDPGFVDAAGGDFHLTPGSSAIDASVTSGIGECDLDGNSRYQGTEEPARADKGCYEFDPDTLALGVTYSALSKLYPGPVAFTATLNGGRLDDGACWWTFDGREPTAESHDAAGACVTNTLAPGTHTVRVKAVVGEQTYEIVKENWFILNGETVYVNPQSENPAVPYASWETAARNINAAFAYLVAGTTMVVSDGTYSVTSEQNLDREVTVRSLNGPAVTTFVDAGDHPFRLTASKALVSGFTFSGFDTWQQGGALYMSAGTVTNCVFRNCRIANGGGGGVNMTGGTLVDCEIDSCHTYRSDNVQYGAGINASGTGCLIDRCHVHDCNCPAANNPTTGAVSLGGGARMRNSVVSDNTIDKVGGVLLSGTSSMENCTVVGNAAKTAGSAGGVSVSSGSEASVVNTIIWNNTNTADQVVRETTGAETAFDTCWTEDPVFKRRGDTWSVRTLSPCMNTGKPLDWMDGAKDFRGNPRVRYGRPDIGAVESSYDPGMMLLVK